jgi:DNA-binding protein HU-beta
MAGKADLVDHVFDNVDGLTKKQAGEAFEAVFGFISKTLSGGDRVQIAGFGTFSVTARAARKGLNPKTKEPIDIPASNNVKFKSGKQLKESVN